MRSRTYTLFDTSRGLSTRTADYQHGDAVIEVRAKSIKQAYYLTAKRIRADGPGALGIIRED
jgi:hypothetical protein